MGKHVVLGAGPVARAIVAALTKRGIEAVVVSRSGTSISGAASVVCDVRDATSLSNIVRDADAVYQGSQPEYHRWPQEFPGHQQCIVDAMRGTNAVLVAVENLYGYGPTTIPLTEDLPLSATTRKGRVRADLWRSLENEYTSGRMKVTAGRASDFFGPYSLDSAVGERYFGPLLKGKKAEVVGNPHSLHSYTYVSDFGEALVRLALDERSLGRAWHVPNAPAITNQQFLEKAASMAGVQPKSVKRGRLSLALAGLFIPPAKETIEMLYEFEHDFVVDHSAYAAAFGDHATPLDESLHTTIDWFRHHQSASK